MIIFIFCLSSSGYSGWPKPFFKSAILVVDELTNRDDCDCLKHENTNLLEHYRDIRTVPLSQKTENLIISFVFIIYKKADWGRQQSAICPNPYHLRNPREIKSSASLHHHFLALVDENVLTLGVISFEN